MCSRVCPKIWQRSLTESSHLQLWGFLLFFFFFGVVAEFCFFLWFQLFGLDYEEIKWSDAGQRCVVLPFKQPCVWVALTLFLTHTEPVLCDNCTNLDRGGEQRAKCSANICVLREGVQNLTSKLYLFNQLTILLLYLSLFVLTNNNKRFATLCCVRTSYKKGSTSLLTSVFCLMAVVVPPLFAQQPAPS